MRLLILFIFILLAGCVQTDIKLGDCYEDYNKFYVRKITNENWFTVDYCILEDGKCTGKNPRTMRKTVLDEFKKVQCQ